MKTVIGIGETILDIIFKDEQPQKAVPGGSVFNAIVSLARCNVNTYFISQTGKDNVGKLIKLFMKNNGIHTEHLTYYKTGKTALSLAFLDNNNNANYQFYKQYQEGLNFSLPNLTKNDILLFGSFYAITPKLQPIIKTLLSQTKNSIVYYDPNFRKTHYEERDLLIDNIKNNIKNSDIVKGSDEDLFYLFDSEDIKEIYKKEIKMICPNFICTCAEKGVWLFTPKFIKHYETDKIKTLSTIGAGDNFNAGFIFELIKLNLNKEDINNLNKDIWDKLIISGIKFSSKVCKSFDNYVPKGFENLL